MMTTRTQAGARMERKRKDTKQRQIPFPQKHLEGAPGNACAALLQSSFDPGCKQKTELKLSSESNGQPRT